MHPVRWLWLAIAASGASAVPVIDIADTRIDVRAAAAPIPPSQDPFYQPPSGYENSAPGTILKSRPVPVPVAFYSYDPVNVKGAYQLLYRTTDSHGNPEAAVTTVIQPYNADAGKLVSYQTAEDAPFVDCAPSYTFQFGSQDFGNGQKIELLLILAALNKGYYVNTPDYEGPKAAFAAGIQPRPPTHDTNRAPPRPRDPRLHPRRPLIHQADRPFLQSQNHTLGLLWRIPSLRLGRPAPTDLRSRTPARGSSPGRHSPQHHQRPLHDQQRPFRGPGSRRHPRPRKRISKTGCIHQERPDPGPEIRRFHARQVTMPHPKRPLLRLSGRILLLHGWPGRHQQPDPAVRAGGKHARHHRALRAHLHLQIHQR